MHRSASDQINRTHDPRLASWVPGSEAGPFPIQNLPFGCFRPRQSGADPRIGVAIGHHILDLRAGVESSLIPATDPALTQACSADSLVQLMGLDASARHRLRLLLSDLLVSDSPQQDAAQACLVAQQDVEMLLAAPVRNFTDFYTSIHHAQNAGRLVRPDNPLLPNFHHLPVAYHARASSVCVSGTPLRRPHGQRLTPEGDVAFGPTEGLDFECELGVLVGPGNRLGTPIPLAASASAIFGVCLLNDWSARDFQRWESQPLGPFLSKNFLTTVSPWIVTLEALAPFRVPAAARDAQAPELLPYLIDPDDRQRGGLDIRMQVRLETARMRERGQPPTVISRPQFKDQYWTIFQMLTHQTSNGCNVLTGDLLGTGTISGTTDSELGCLLELTRGGRAPIDVGDGEVRRYLENGDRLILSASCEREGYRSIGFGEASGQIDMG